MNKPQEYEDISQEDCSHLLEETGDIDALLAPIEAILMVAEAPVTAAQIAPALGVSTTAAECALQHLAAQYPLPHSYDAAPHMDEENHEMQGTDDRTNSVTSFASDTYTAAKNNENRGRPHGFYVKKVAGGWRIYSAPQYSDVVARFVVGSAQTRLSQAALETLAVIAYRQPISRSRISHIRGVNVDAVVRTLVARGLIEEVDESLTGARLYGTTPAFLERMGFNSLDDLVPLAPYLPAQEELDELEELL
ncbi:SMC-Scp complex subunit ScpB [Schaalia sp. lx-260]|uniref:SMC-Scp complex subunit ScpB n=1 Tax=Schaalia sp. lx-260 TaxID=2899082 RepID=UPI001E42129C|nr:SMC-Scp complex subunit ScpB [Schaalia sp. lx-260]MCD4549371.1 SMC-Scp complex subunit ScpB [Schaalia sp. lx-260]